MTIDSLFVTVSGLPSYEEQQIDFPSGTFGIPLSAHLSSLNATFGFNDSAHKFDLEYIPDSFQDETLPPIGSGVSFYVGDIFLVEGRITHSDFAKSEHGNVVSVTIEDIRTDLNNFYVDTFGVFGSQDSPSKNIVDVRYWYLKSFAETRSLGRSVIVRDLDLLDTVGASYRQIYEAIKYFEEQVGTINDVISKIPNPNIIESQLPFDPDAYRWQFKCEPLLQVLVRILGDVSFDFYWNMSSRKIDVINRKFAVRVERDKIPVSNDPAPVTSLRYGKDQAERSTSVKIFGAEMEGLVGIGRLKTQSGAYDLSPSGVTGNSLYDLGISIGAALGRTNPRFVPAWRNARIKYFGPDGSIRIDRPTDRELKSSLKSIEYWAMEKGLENRIDASTVHQDFGSTAIQISRTSASGLGFIENRGQLEREWVIEWYNRVRNFAQNNFARAYMLSTDSALYDELDQIEVVSAAWCNIENLTDDGAFEDNYKIKNKYRYIAPFWDKDINKMRGFASFLIQIDRQNGVVSPKWGADGKGVPSQYTSYNEEQDFQYVPIEVKQWDRAEDKFQEEYLAPLFEFEKGLLIRLPNICWKSYGTVADNKYQTKPILQYFHETFKSETQSDIVTDPIAAGDIYESITDVAIPIKVKRRYGFKWPFPWASGTGVDLEVIVQEDLAPWNFEPRGQKTSWALMEDEAKSILANRVSDRNFVTFAEVSKLGLPIISFDNFANQNITPDGYGIISHGITNIGLTKNTGWWQTKYNLKSHYPQLIKAKPIKDKTEEDFEFIIRRLEGKIPPPSINPFQSPSFFDDNTEDRRASFPSNQKISITVPVTITQVFDASTNPYYVGIDERGVTWPAAFRDLTSLHTDSLLYQERRAFATDGYLQVGMAAIYHYEELENGRFTHFFTGGISLSSSRIVEMLESPRLVESIYRANVKTISETVYDIKGNPVVVSPFTIFNVPFLNQQSVDTSIKSGDKAFMGGNGNENNVIKPNFDVKIGDSKGAGKDSVRIINTGVPTTGGFAVVTKRPDDITGLGGEVQTISTSGGTRIADGASIGGSVYNVRFIGLEYDQVAIGDPCMTIKEKEQGQSGQVRLYCFIPKVLFAPGNASGSSIFTE